MWGLKIQIKNNSYPVEVYRIMINEARHHLDVRLKPKSDYIQIRQGETKTILPGELCRQQIYTFDASIRIYLITPFEEAYEIRYINTDRLNYYQSEPVPILYSKEDHESSKVQTTQVRQYSIHGGIKGVISIRMRLFVYLPLSKNFCIATVIPIPETAIRIQPVVAFQINPECKISALATIMHTKKEDRATTMIIKM